MVIIMEGVAAVVVDDRGIERKKEFRNGEEEQQGEVEGEGEQEERLIEPPARNIPTLSCWGGRPQYRAGQLGMTTSRYSPLQCGGVQRRGLLLE